MALTSTQSPAVSSRYAAVHNPENLRGPGDARPTAEQIIQDENLVGKMTDRVILITGVSSGIGIEAAKALLTTGATVYGTARNTDKAKAALGPAVQNPRFHLLELNLESLDSVRACAAAFKSQSTQLNILINNAGVMHTPEGRTADGFETQFGVNHLAHFLLLMLLHQTLLESSTPSFHSRVVNVSSSGHKVGNIHWDNLNLEGEYDGWAAYGQSKTAAILAANHLETLFGARGLHGLSLHPGGILTGLQLYTQDEFDAFSKDPVFGKYMKSPAQGAATSTYAAVAAELEGKGALYLEDCAPSFQSETEGDYSTPGYAKWVLDRESQERLWEVSLKMVGL